MMYLDEWDENTNINWWDECRKKLNKVIRKFNKWQINGMKEEKVVKLLARIEHGKQTFGSRDGGSGYWYELNKMETFIKNGIWDGKGKTW